MLIRQTYHMEKQQEIKELIIEIIDNLLDITEHYEIYFNNPSKDIKETIIKNESYVDKNEKKIEEYILEIFSLEQLTVEEIKWLLAMNRIIRELERCGDYLINIITISDVIDMDEIEPMIKQFFVFEIDMINWLKNGIKNDDVTILENVIKHDKHVNKLNKQTYDDVASQLQENKDVSESKLKMVVISRFLERLGDHLVNAAKAYVKIVKG